MTLLSVTLGFMLLIATPAIAQKKFLAFSGGPDGGTFQYFSNGISVYLSKGMDGYEVSNMASAGSVENLRRLNSRDADFGITYSGDLYLGRNGRLTNDTRQYRNVHVVSYLRSTCSLDRTGWIWDQQCCRFSGKESSYWSCWFWGSCFCAALL
jgi:TRAP-type uncharacterized transport system substrate-binding protein